MRIKKLAIHGFKSFVDRVTLDFPAAPSAIIGPNGCGKSNVVDAIRWVTGEQNPRHLRGRQMEDVIFNGSDSRKPLGMAEVVITFSNERGRAPARFAAFTEIEVARRLYRSGESEYSLNKVRCRLRDIVDLFTDTGVGKDGYSIVEQGQIGWLINARPEDRRVLFEEAAGINRFRHKKDAALRRLESTKENLTRVSDIISEVKRQLNSLNRQAKKAERYRVFREELKGIDLHLAAIELSGLTEKLKETSKRLEIIKDSDLELANRIASKELTRDGLGDEYAGVEAGYNSVKERIFELEKAVQAEERTIALAGMRVEELNRNEKRMAAEMEELRTKRLDVLKEVEDLKGSIKEDAALIEARTKSFNELSGELDGVTEELKKRQDARSLLKSEIVSASARVSDIKHAIQTCLKDEEVFLGREAGARAKSEEVEKAIAGHTGPISGLKKAIEASRRDTESSGAEFGSLAEKLSALERRRRDLDEELKGARQAHASRSARKKTLEEMERNYENINGGARDVMLKGNLSGVIGILADIMETSPGYERAVEAVMGERLQYVIVDGQKEGIEAIGFLKSSSGGRGSFVPVRDLRPLPQPATMHAGGPGRPGVKELMDTVRVSERYAGIVSSFLGDTLLVEDLNTASEIWRGNGMYKTLVTPDGDVITPQGIVTGGGPGRNEGGILQKRGEIKEIKNGLAVLDARILELEGGIKTADSEIEDTKRTLDEARSRFHSMEIDAVNLDGELRRRETELGGLEETLEGLVAEIKETDAALGEVSTRKLELGRERDALEGELNEKEGLLAELTSEISVIEDKREGLSQAVTDVKITLARTTERHNALKARIAEKENAAGELETARSLRAGEMESGRIEAAERLKAVEGVKARVEGLLKEIEDVRSEERDKREALAGLSARIKELESLVRGLKQDLGELQELKGEITIEIKETELRIDHLKEKTLESYGIDLEGFSPEAMPEETEDAPDLPALDARRTELREKISSMGEVSLSALDEFNELEERHRFLLEQQTDLTGAVESLMRAIARINRTTKERFVAAFAEINKKFKENFPRFFNGGRAELRLTDESDVLGSGIDIVAQPPGKRLQNIALLSGGEKALTATSLIFSIFLIKPSPFCLLDEVDAPLDEMNIDRFNGFVREISPLSQFILITHNKRTMEMVDRLYGVTMEEPGVSKIVSVKF